MLKILNLTFIVFLIFFESMHISDATAQTRVYDRPTIDLERLENMKEEKPLNNLQIMHLMNLFTQAAALPDNDEKAALAKEMHLLTGVQQFFIGDDVYGFAGFDGFSEEKHIERHNCMLHINNSVDSKSKLISISEIKENCRAFIPEITGRFGYQTTD